jgi:HPt (histidine-containing phosphotransfer) domain-containing protein
MTDARKKPGKAAARTPGRTSRRPGAPAPSRMARATDHDVIMPDNTLKARAVVRDDRGTETDEQSVQRAERSLKALSHHFAGWMEDELARLERAWTELAHRRDGAGSAERLHRAAHDIKGHGATLGFPLAARAAASLCQLLEAMPYAAVDPVLVASHVNAVRVMCREEGQAERQVIAGNLAESLEAATAMALARHQGVAVQLQ